MTEENDIPEQRITHDLSYTSNDGGEGTVRPGSYSAQMVEAITNGTMTIGQRRPLQLATSNMVSAQYALRKVARRQAVDNLLMKDFIRAPQGVCPRCLGDCPEPGRRMAWPGAVSRTDNKTEVCSECGDDEGLEDMQDRLIPQSQWPVPRPAPTATWEQNRGHGGSPMMPFPGPKELPDLRLHLLDRWQPGGLFEKVACSADPQNGFGWSQIARSTLQDASLWWIKEDMVLLTETTCKTIKVDACALDFQMPANQQRGLVCFERPWLGQDAKDPSVRVQVSALAWCRLKLQDIPCLQFTYYSYLDFGAGMDAGQLSMAAEQRLFADGWNENWRSPEGVLGPDGHAHYRLRGGAWALLGSTTWPIRDTIEDFSLFDSMHGPEVGADQKQSMMEDRRFFAAFCTLVNMRLTEVSEEHVPNYRRKQAKRKGHPMTNPSPVRIVRLREHRGDDDTERDPDAETRRVNWSHRWIVNGYWKYVWFGKGKTKKRLVYIAPFMKGPKDKPLVIKDTVRVWTE